MKRIACISTLISQPDDGDASTQLMALYNSTRVYNREHDITGVFLVSESNCLQIMEGNSESLASAIYRIGREKRMSDLSVVMNCHTDVAEFSGWKIRFINDKADAHLDFITKLKATVADKIEAKSSADSARLERFFGRADASAERPIERLAAPSVVSLDSKAPKSYEDSVVSIASWPRPTQMRLTPELIRLCSNLIKRPAHFERILALQLCSSKATLSRYLASLDGLGLLRIHSSVSGPNLRVVDGSTAQPDMDDEAVKKPSDRFSRVLRRFIASAKS